MKRLQIFGALWHTSDDNEPYLSAACRNFSSGKCVVQYCVVSRTCVAWCELCLKFSSVTVNVRMPRMPRGGRCMYRWVSTLHLRQRV